ncbi:hypothetical protein [Alteromonas gracilis]|uniref:hypothetical protein n=1 Tax=Alteromonas gracilis TaxID=1479524 RepID=UPI003736C63E
MQVDMFGSAPAPVKRNPVDVKRYDWEQKLEDVIFKREQGDFVSDFNPASNVTTYRSGSSARADILGYIRAKSPIGICILDASAPVRGLVADYVSQGGHVFIDSGAFRVFKKTLKNPLTPPINFKKVFALYRDVIDQCENLDGLIVVAPDEVGKQQNSYDLLVQYHQDIEELYQQGVSFMVPMQKGALSIKEHYNRCRELLGFDFIVGLPSNAEALSPRETFDFVQAVNPSRVHFLGCAETALVHEAKFKAPLTHFSCDATKLRKHIGQGRLLTEMHNQVLDEVVQCAQHGMSHASLSGIGSWDETEVLGDLLGHYHCLPRNAQANFAKALSVSMKDIESAEDNDELWELLGRFNYNSEYDVGLFFETYCRSTLSPQVRTNTVEILANLGLV